MTFTAGTPKEYIEKKNTIESFYGSTQEDITRDLGEPEWIESRGGSTYYIYESRQTDTVVGFVVFLPVVGARDKVKWHCLLLEFDEDNRLVHHESASDSDDDPLVVPIYNPMGIKERNCLDIFEAPTKRLIKEIGLYCPNAELGHAYAQKRIADIFNLGLFNVGIDPIRSYVWYNLASTNGDIGASNSISKVVEQMSSAQLSEAQLLLKQWEPGHCEIDLLEMHRELVKKE